MERKIDKTWLTGWWGNPGRPEQGRKPPRRWSGSYCSSPADASDLETVADEEEDVETKDDEEEVVESVADEEKDKNIHI